MKNFAPLRCVVWFYFVKRPKRLVAISHHPTLPGQGHLQCTLLIFRKFHLYPTLLQWTSLTLYEVMPPSAHCPRIPRRYSRRILLIRTIICSDGSRIIFPLGFSLFFFCCQNPTLLFVRKLNKISRSNTNSTIAE